MSVEDKYADTVAIVYPASSPGDEYNLPIDKEIRTHVTLSILGEISTTNITKEQLITMLRNVEWEAAEEANVLGMSLFGPEEDFLVMELDSPALHRNWKQAHSLLSEAGVSYFARFPDYRPHITLKHDYTDELPSCEHLPTAIKIGAPTLWWGTEVISLS